MLASSGDATEPCPVPLSLTNYILDADIRSFFDTVSQDWLVRFVEHRIGDVFRQDMAADWHPLAVCRAKRPDSQVHDFQATQPIALDYGCMPRTKAQSSPPAPGAIAGALPAAQAPQLCQLVTEPPESADWLSEIKFDGYRLIGSINQGRVRLLTRKGLDWADRLPHVAAAFARLDVTTAMLDGELVALRPDGLSSFPELQAFLSKGADHMLQRVRPAAPQRLGPAAVCAGRPQKSPFRLVFWSGLLRYSEHVDGSAGALYQRACATGA
jgi:ATP dependent DNA ligase domain